MADKTKEILHMGWLIKSPPENKMNRAFLKAVSIYGVCIVQEVLYRDYIRIHLNKAYQGICYL